MTKMKNEDWKNIKYFKKEEFKCKCNGKWCNGYPVDISKELIQNMDKIREKYKKPIIITSGIRCKKQNARVGGVANSEHMKGLASDFYFSGMNKYSVISYIKSLPNYNYSYTNNTNMKYAIHYDVKNITTNNTANKYTTGNYIITSSYLRVRTGPSTNYRIKTFKEFTKEDQNQILKLNNKKKQDGYTKGLKCTILQIQNNNWGKTNSGWICLNYAKKN